MPKVDNRVFYLNAYENYGITPKGVCWSSKEHQHTRFAQALKIIQKIDKCSVVDVGCGFGDLYLYMQEREKQPKKYIGIDNIEEFVTIAKKRTNQEILCCDVLYDKLPEADYYICNGALNTLTKFESFLFIKRALQHSKKGFVFNFLEGTKESDVYNYIAYNELETMVKEFGGKIFYKAKGYIKNDMTVGICARSLE